MGGQHILLTHLIAPFQSDRAMVSNLLLTSSARVEYLFCLRTPWIVVRVMSSNHSPNHALAPRGGEIHNVHSASKDHKDDSVMKLGPLLQWPIQQHRLVVLVPYERSHDIMRRLEHFCMLFPKGNQRHNSVHRLQHEVQTMYNRPCSWWWPGQPTLCPPRAGVIRHSSSCRSAPDAIDHTTSA